MGLNEFYVFGVNMIMYVVANNNILITEHFGEYNENNLL